MKRSGNLVEVIAEGARIDIDLAQRTAEMTIPLNASIHVNLVKLVEQAEQMK